MADIDIVNFSTKDLDFDDIVANLRNFMRYQDEFSDYDFTGSALSTLINTLAYNTHYNGVYDNFAINESFLDSAIKRASVISHANLINYTPRSATAATAIVDVIVYDDNIDVSNKAENTPIALPDKSLFTTTIDGKQYSFFTESAMFFEKDFTTYTIKNVVLKQGTYVTTQQKYNGSSFQKFVIGNDNVDITTLHVQVYHGDSVYTFERADNVVDIDNTSKVYFLTMDGSGHYQIQFGSGMMGYSLSAGDTVYMSYIACDGSQANNAKSFLFSATPSQLGFSNNATIDVICTSKSAGGSEPEDIESIRLLAPKMFAAQDRCVTESDFQTVIKSQYGNAKSVKVWGGENNNPPQYGKVFVSIIPKQGNVLTSAEKTIVKNIVEKRHVIGTGGIEVVDPSIINIHINSTVYYNPSKSINTTQDIESMARAAILNYNQQYLGDFNSVLKFSKLSSAIDNCDGGIAVDNNNTRIRISSTITPEYGVLIGYTLNLSNAIYRPKVASECVLSTGFYCDNVNGHVCYIDDDPVTSSLRLFYYDKEHRKVIVQSVGTVDYINGVLTIDKLKVTSLEEFEWRFTINPASNDVITRQNQFAVISNDDLTVNAVSVASDSSYIQVSSK